MYLGIDFGTCYSSAALLLEGVPTPIPAPLTPGYALPSSVFITEQGEILVGQAAENKRQKNPQRYRREFKRDLGSPDPYTLGNVSMLPEELVAAVLKKLKEEAEKVALGRGEKFLTNALITVPATYSSYKRNLMQDAGRKAGFSQIEMLEEPVAAARYYSCHAQINDGDIILVYDLGGGTFDATLMQKQGDNYQVLAMPKGLANCGGTDFDRLIYQQLKLECSDELRQQLEPKDAWLARAIVGDFCRDLKHQLSEQTEASIYIPMGLGNVETFELTREVFNAMIAPLIEETLDCCEQLVRSAKKDWTQVNQMLLVGGSSRIPYVKEAIERRFNISPFLIDKPELAVCLGATIKNSIPEPIPEPIPSPQDIIKTHINLGDNLYQQGKLEEAIAEYKEAVHLEPYNVEANHRLQLTEQSLRERLEAERQQREREKIEAEIRAKIEAEQKLEQREKQKNQVILQENISPQNQATVTDISSSKIMTADEYLSIIQPRLLRENFDIAENINYGEYTLNCIASGKKQFTFNDTPWWVMKNIPLISEQGLSLIFIFYEFSTVDIKSYRKFINGGVEYSLKWRKENIKGWQNKMFATVLYPIALFKQFNQEFARDIENENPTQQRGIIDVLPIAFDLRSKRLYFSNRQPLIGYFLWEKLKKITTNVLSI